AAFMSFCVARGFGAEHPLLTIAERLDLDHGVRIGPFTHFYEADAEDSEDTEKLELAWQEPARLAESAAKAATALRDDPRLRELAAKAGEGDLPAQMAALAAEAGRAQEAGA